MKYDFDKVINRTDTADIKWNTTAVKGYLKRDIREDMIPMWIADTDFACPPCIVEAIKARADKEIFGYCAPDAAFYKAVCGWQKAQFNYDIEPSWITMCPTVVASINIAIRALTNPGDGVIIQQPVYDPFEALVKKTGRTPVNNGLINNDGYYTMDYDLLEKQAAEPSNKLLILCSPHNPVGRVWKKEELTRLAEICLAHGVTVITDEIHSDIVFTGHSHTPLLSLDKRYENAFIMLSAPGKTFNIPGLKTGFAIIPNDELRTAFNKTMLEMSLDVRNTFAIEGLTAAYTQQGREWMLEEIAYIEANIKYVSEFLKEHMPRAKMYLPEGTFLCWVDLSAYGLSDDVISARIIDGAGVICVPGPWFGNGGEQHVRLNAGCPRSVLQTALERIAVVMEV